MAWIKPDPRDLALTPQEADERWRAARKRMEARALPIPENERKTSRPPPPVEVPTSHPDKQEVAEKSAPVRPPKPPIRSIAEVVVKKYDDPEVTLDEMMEPPTGRGSWKYSLSQARRMLYLVADDLGWSLSIIGQAVGGRQYETVRTGIKTLKKEAERNPKLKTRALAIKQAVQEAVNPMREG